MKSIYDPLYLNPKTFEELKITYSKIQKEESSLKEFNYIERLKKLRSSKRKFRITNKKTFAQIMKDLSKCFGSYQKISDELNRRQEINVNRNSVALWAGKSNSPIPYKLIGAIIDLYDDVSKVQ